VFGLGIWELAIILAIIILIFGAGRLPQLGGAIGKTITSFKRETKELREKEEEKPKDD